MKRIGSTSKAQKQRSKRIAQHRDVDLGLSGLVTGKVSGLVILAGSAAGAVTLASALTVTPAYALPSNGIFLGGTGSITQPNPSTLNINQSSNKIIINWFGYNIGAGEAVNYLQPGIGSIALNRVIGGSSSFIDGKLTGNGQVWVINPNGMLFGPNATVNTGGFLATTFNISDSDFMAGSYAFAGARGSLSSIVNRGNIQVSDGGYVVLSAPSVTNKGAIVANLGKVHLASGDAMTVNFAGNDLINLVVDSSASQDALGVANAGRISADGGQVVLSANVAGSLLKEVVNNTGLVEARSIGERNGVIVLDGGSQGAVSSGTLDASGKNAGETGGTVKVLGDGVRLASGSTIDVSGDAGGGTALLGGNFHGEGPERNASSTTVENGAVIDADAIAIGNGGKIAVWSDGATSVAGSLSARGGSNAGDGGFIETSGKNLSIGDGTVADTRAANGNAGSLLLDPTDFTVAWSGGDITADALDSILNGGNVVINTTGSSGAGSGNININAWVNWNAATTLTLSAYKDININEWITNSVGGNLVARADNTGTGIGTINTGCTGGFCANVNLPGGLSTFIYNPTSYATPINFSSFVTGGGIDARMLVFLTGGTVSDKTYDGTTSASIVGNPAFSIDPTAGGTYSVSLVAGTASFVDKNAGNNKPVYFSGYSLGGGDANKFWIAAQPAGTTATITPKAITVSGITASDKVYDQTTAANLDTAGAVLTGGAASAGDKKYYSGDDVHLVTAGASGTFVDKNAGNGKDVTVSGLSLNGADAGNYTVTDASLATADITPKAITVTGITAGSKVYDATDLATLNTAGATLTGGAANAGDNKFYSGDSVSVVTDGASGHFADKNAANGKAVTVAGLSLSGTDAGNYTVTDASLATANVTPKAITVSGITASDKVYDRNTYAGINTAGAALTDGAASAGDKKFYTGDDVHVVTTLASGNFADKNAANGKAVTVSGLSLSGSDAGNYTVADASGATANITPKPLAVQGITADDKVYDATTGATIHWLGAAAYGGASNADDGLFYGGDSFTLHITAPTGQFADKNAGNGKTVTVSGLSLTGTDAGNYAVFGTAKANVTPKAITVSGITASDKVYDATNLATLNTTGALLTGGAASAGDKKFYSGDDVTLVTSGAGGNFADKNAGNGKAVTVSGLGLSGVDAGNYMVSDASNATANITPKAVTASGITAASKVYDTTSAATIDTTGATLTDGAAGAADKRYYTGDDVHVVTAGASGSFTDKNAANAKTVTVSGLTLSGVDAGNYTVSDASGATANITPKQVTVSGITASDKVYDAASAATINTAGAALTGGAASSGDKKVYSGDDVTLVVAGASGNFADKNAGNGKAVTVSGLSLNGADAGNYAVSDASNATANITPKAITVNGITAADKVYDSTTVATLNIAGAALADGAANAGDNKFYTGDDVHVVAAGAGGSFADKNVGNGKAVTVAGLTLSGLDAGNYSVSDASNATANIAPKAITSTGITATDKVYDGTTGAAINTAGGALTGGAASASDNRFYTGDDVALIASGASGSFADKNVANGKAVTVTGLTLSGADAGNYTVSDASGATANITPKDITAITAITANDKVYDGHTDAMLVTGGAQFSGIVAGDDLSVATAAGNFSDKNVGVGKTVGITGLSLGGADAGNYNLTDTTASTTATITQRPSVTWTGAAADGLWSNPLNWEVGAIPDLANVAQVVIPADKGAVTFDSHVTPLGGAVQVDNISSTGTLIVESGNLNVANSLATSKYQQTGGDVSVFNGMTVTDGFNQTGSGTLTVGTGNLSVTQTAGDLVLGSIKVVSGNIDAVVANGGITQNAPFEVGADGSSFTTAAAGNAIVLDQANAFNGKDLALHTNGAGADVTITGDGLKLAASNVGGNFAATSSGSVTQNGILNVDGRTDITVTSANSDVVLGEANNLRGLVTVAGSVQNLTLHNTATRATFVIPGTIGNDLTLTMDKAAVVLSSETVGGDLNVIANGGAVTQTGAVRVSGATAITSTDRVNLGNAGNDFVEVVKVNSTDVILADGKDALNAEIVASGSGYVSAQGALTVSGSTGTSLQTSSGGDTTFGASSVGSNLSAGSGGKITGSGGLTVYGTSGITASGDITLADSRNDFRGAVTVAGKNITVDDSGSLTIQLAAAGNGFVTANHDLSLGGSAGGNLDTRSLGSTSFRETAVGGNLTANSGGTVTQNGTLAVNGGSNITALGDITLANAGNDFGYGVTATGANVTLQDKNDLAVQVASRGAATLDAVGSLALGGSVGSALKATSGGDITEKGALAVKESASLTAAGDITLANSGNDFSGVVTATGNNVSLSDKNDLTVVLAATGSGTLKAGGALTVSGTTDALSSTSGGNMSFGDTSVTGDLTASAGGEVSQTDLLAVARTSAITANGNIALGDLGNRFTGAVAAKGKDIALGDKDDLIVQLTATGSGNLKAGGNLTVSGSTGTSLETASGGNTSFGGTSVGSDLSTTSGGDVTQTGAVSVKNSATIDAGGSADLGNAHNDFGTVVAKAGKDVLLTDSNGLGADVTAGSAVIKADGDLSVQGALSSALTTSSGGDTKLGKTSVGSDLNTTSAGSVTQDGALAVGGAANMVANGDIALADRGNDFQGPVNAVGNNVTLADANNLAAHVAAAGSGDLSAGGALVASGSTGKGLNTASGAGTNFGTTTVGGDLTTTSGGSVSGDVLTVAGTTEVTVTSAHSDVILDRDNDLAGLVTVGSAGSGSVRDLSLHNIHEDAGFVLPGEVHNLTLKLDNAPVVLAAETVTGDLALSGNGVAQTGAVTVTGSSTISGGKDDITLSKPDNDFGGQVTAKGGNISLRDKNNLAAAIEASGSGNLTAGGDLRVSGSAKGGLTTSSTGSTSFGSGGSPEKRLASEGAGFATTVGGDLSVTAGGNVTQDAPVTVAGTTAITAKNGSISLSDSGNDFGGKVTAAGTNITLTDKNDLTVALAAGKNGDSILKAGGDVTADFSDAGDNARSRVAASAGEDVVVNGKGDVTVNLSGKTIDLTTTGNVAGKSVASRSNRITANTVGSEGNPYVMQGPSDGLHIHITTDKASTTGDFAGYFEGNNYPTQASNTFADNRLAMVKWNGRLFGGGQDFALAEEVSSVSSSFANTAVSGELLQKMLLLSSFEEFFNVAPKETIMDAENTLIEGSGLHFLEGRTPTGGVCTIIKSK